MISISALVTSGPERFLSLHAERCASLDVLAQNPPKRDGDHRCPCLVLAVCAYVEEGDCHDDIRNSGPGLRHHHRHGTGNRLWVWSPPTKLTSFPWCVSLPRQTSLAGAIFLPGASAPSLAPVVILLLDYEPRFRDKARYATNLGHQRWWPTFADMPSSPRRFPPPWPIEKRKPRRRGVGAGWRDDELRRSL